MRIAFALLALAACTFPTRSEELACSVTADCDDGRVCQSGFCVRGEPETDGGRATEQPDADTFDCTAFNTRHFAGCDIPRPTGALDIGANATYDTDAGTLSVGAAPANVVIGNVRVISVQSFSITNTSTLRVIGSKPLIIASWSTVTVDGTLDVSSSIANGIGAGANPTDCTTRTANVGQNNENGAGGGGGGALRAVGGRGGNGDAGANGSGGGSGGTAATTAPLLIGGCAGATGGVGRQNGGGGGAGGGAIQLAALESITVGGKIHAGGAGGAGAAGENGGGGGGGSGGMIGLESATVTITGTLAANGGAGGGGSTDNNNATGSPGQDGQLSATRATGGAPNNNGGGQGGLGGAGATLAGNQGQDDGVDSGGGGGGSCGFVVIAATNAPSLGGTISPAATTLAR